MGVQVVCIQEGRDPLIDLARDLTRRINLEWLVEILLLVLVSTLKEHIKWIKFQVRIL